MHLGDRPVPGFPVSTEGMDDITDLIVEHRDEIPFSDQLPTLDPPTHTNHRALLMRLITPKRLKENEDAMWQLADDILDEFLAPADARSKTGSGEGEFIKGFAAPFTLRVIADLLGVPGGPARNCSSGWRAARMAVASVTPRRH